MEPEELSEISGMLEDRLVELGFQPDSDISHIHVAVGLLPLIDSFYTRHTSGSEYLPSEEDEEESFSLGEESSE